MLFVSGKQRILKYTKKELIKGWCVVIQNKYVPDGTLYGMALYVLYNESISRYTANINFLHI